MKRSLIYIIFVCAVALMSIGNSVDAAAPPTTEPVPTTEQPVFQCTEYDANGWRFVVHSVPDEALVTTAFVKTAGAPVFEVPAVYNSFEIYVVNDVYAPGETPESSVSGWPHTLHDDGTITFNEITRVSVCWKYDTDTPSTTTTENFDGFTWTCNNHFHVGGYSYTVDGIPDNVAATIAHVKTYNSPAFDVENVYNGQVITVPSIHGIAGYDDLQLVSTCWRFDTNTPAQPEGSVATAPPPVVVTSPQPITELPATGAGWVLIALTIGGAMSIIAGAGFLRLAKSKE